MLKMPHHIQFGGVTAVRVVCRSCLKAMTGVHRRSGTFNCLTGKQMHTLPADSMTNLHAVRMNFIFRDGVKQYCDPGVNYEHNITFKQTVIKNLKFNYTFCDKFIKENSDNKNIHSSFNVLKSAAPLITLKTGLCNLRCDKMKTKVANDGIKVQARRHFHSSCNKFETTGGPGASHMPLRKEPPWRVMFFGTDQIAVETLKELHTNMIESGTLVKSLDVVTVKDKTPRAVKKFAEYVNLNVQEWPLPCHQRDKYDVGILVSFGHLIPDSVIHMFPYGILNMHPSLLPRWRGASPIIHTILNGDSFTGVSIMEIRPKHFDIGPLLLQRHVQVPSRCTSLQLADIMARFGASMMIECLKDLPALEKFEHEQDYKGITYAHKIKAKNANLDWEGQTAYEVDCQYRAVGELFTLRTELNGHVVKLQELVDPQLLTGVYAVKGYGGDIRTARPGTVGYHKQLDCIIVCCKEGIVGFKSLVLKKKLRPVDFYNGYLNGRDSVVFNSLTNDINRYVEVERVPLRKKL